MVNLRLAEDGVVQPKPRYGHLSAIDPEFALLKETVDMDFETLWALPLTKFVEAWRVAPPALLDDSPVIGKDITVEHMKVPVRDGSMIDIRIYKPITPVPNTLLNFNVHGGGPASRGQVRYCRWLTILVRMDSRDPYHGRRAKSIRGSREQSCGSKSGLSNGT
jgi:hypothetical protein